MFETFDQQCTALLMIVAPLMNQAKLFSTQDLKWVPQKTQNSYTSKTGIFPILMALRCVSDIMMWPKYWNNWRYESRITEDFWGTHCVGAKNMLQFLLTSAHSRIPCNLVPKYRVHLAVHQGAGGMFIMCSRAEQLGHSLPYTLYRNV